ncbi:putative kinesin light [Rosellinia necatrix]|uniref:Putative kinesin light n=1 Tax=Rosellinia necatrix TaxID=77044 RepID=A0A1W2TQL9_ROSNE|nr:putative kinesin light [Rosellinia necatrix]
MATGKGDVESFIRFEEGNLSPESPRISVKLSAPSHLSLTLPYQIRFTLRRAQSDTRDQTCILRWSPTIDAFSPSGLVLLRHLANEGGYEIISVDHYTGLVPLPEKDAIVVNGHNQSLWELALGGHVSFVANLPERYYRVLRADETYTLLYPGIEDTMWEWGRMKDNLGARIKREVSFTPGQRLVIPGGDRVTFTAESEAQPWPDRARVEASDGFSIANSQEQQWRLNQIKRGIPSPISVSERVPGTPALTVTIVCAVTVQQQGTFEVVMKVKYDGVVGHANASHAPAIIFHTQAFVNPRDPRHGFRAYRSRDKGRNWESCELDDGSLGASLFVDGPDIVVSVAQEDMNRHFASLLPGEEWSTKLLLQGSDWSCLPDDSVPGDVFRYSFAGTALEWWDWGTKDDHKDTFVSLPPWLHGHVTKPQDNGGRGTLMVPGSDVVEFVMTE